MAARSSWKGFLKLSLVSVPVKAYTATASGGGEIRLNQLHAECNSRINYKKTCPIHGEVPSDQIVSGFEYSKGQYVIVDTDELEKLRTEDDKAINIDTLFALESRRLGDVRVVIAFPATFASMSCVSFSVYTSLYLP